MNAAMDVKVQARNWYSRGPSKSNPADDASRLVFSDYKNSIRSRPDYVPALEFLNESWKLASMLEMGR